MNKRRAKAGELSGRVDLQSRALVAAAVVAVTRTMADIFAKELAKPLSRQFVFFRGRWYSPHPPEPPPLPVASGDKGARTAAAAARRERLPPGAPPPPYRQAAWAEYWDRQTQLLDVEKRKCQLLWEEYYRASLMARAADDASKAPDAQGQGRAHALALLCGPEHPVVKTLLAIPAVGLVVLAVAICDENQDQKRGGSYRLRKNRLSSLRVSYTERLDETGLRIGPPPRPTPLWHFTPGLAAPVADHMQLQRGRRLGEHASLVHAKLDEPLKYEMAVCSLPLGSACDPPPRRLGPDAHLPPTKFSADEMYYPMMSPRPPQQPGPAAPGASPPPPPPPMRPILIPERQPLDEWELPTASRAGGLTEEHLQRIRDDRSPTPSVIPVAPPAGATLYGELYIPPAVRDARASRRALTEPDASEASLPGSVRGECADSVLSQKGAPDGDDGRRRKRLRRG
eukprot:TRINITY_DN1274_c1_g1_i1.p1 TRINITY_DN1274_c1_g1~~TRINITY_DN1274_c1_g1_i1.p1  ORF type:complete len:455 (+),score=56.37 TRINITY_DN1274_c1_g1_i1:98-1462(+)